MSILQRLFGKQSTTDLKSISRNAVIVDVRSHDEYRSGHIKASINIPLQSLGAKTSDLKKLNKPVITCCASGIRSGMAKKVLEKAGIEAYNGGGWDHLQARLK